MTREMWTRETTVKERGGTVPIFTVSFYRARGDFKGGKE